MFDLDISLFMLNMGNSITTFEDVLIVVMSLLSFYVCTPVCHGKTYCMED